MFLHRSRHAKEGRRATDQRLAHDQDGDRPGRLRRAVHRVRSLSRLQRFLIALVAFPPIVAGGAASAYYLHLHRVAGAQTLKDLGATPALNSSRRLLVLSPHCDDETLGAGALIADARRDGIPVSVAFLTNGDGFRVAASRALGEMSVSPADFVRFAEQRQLESLAALRELGVADAAVRFLGYPDRGLKPMWERNWSPSTPFCSAYTNHIRCPYPGSYTPRSLYCGEYLVQDLVRLMETDRPTDIYVTHPSDDHPDHLMAAAYAGAALRICRERAGDASWAPAARIHYYIIHRGDWPLPQGLHPKLPLLPPSGMTNLDTVWQVYRPTPEALAAKRRALERYVSQTSIEGRFLRSFVRATELFGDIDEHELPMGGGVPVDGRPAEVSAIDPIGDDLVRYATPSADITGLSIRALPGGSGGSGSSGGGGSSSDDRVEIRVQMHGSVSRRVHYGLLVRAMGVPESPNLAAAETIRSRFVSLPLKPMAPGTGTLAADVSLSSLGLTAAERDRCLWICAETRVTSRLPVLDRTGYRLFPIEDAPAPPAVAGAAVSPSAVAPTAASLLSPTAR